MSATGPFNPSCLSPLQFLDRARAAHRDRVGYLGDEGRTTYAELGERVDRLAGALRSLGVVRGDRVSTLMPNTRAALEAHFGVPAAGAVLNAINTRLSTDEVRYIVDHAGSKVVLVDHMLLDLARDALDTSVRLVVVGGDDDGYEHLLADASPYRDLLEDEWSLLSLNYTSGTTGRPKGVMYSHRGAFLQALAMQAHLTLDAGTVFLWTLPMFHCNGWCFPWALTGVGATHVGLRRVEPEAAWNAIQRHGVTHLNAAPTVLVDLVNASAAPTRPLDRTLRVATGGAPPSPSLLDRLAALNISVTHLYGLTETYGPAALCDWRPEWNGLAADTQASLLARQGVGNVVSAGLRVVDERGNDVPADGETIGEIVIRGDNVMLGYYRDDEATQRAALDGWFRSGDLATMDADGYVSICDRAKDVIISGGENIGSVEVEHALAAHPAVAECAVVAAPDDRWGEVPVAYVQLAGDAEVDGDELIAFVKERIARFKAPKRVVFGPLPKTATGKIQKFVLRERARAADQPADGGR